MKMHCKVLGSLIALDFLFCVIRAGGTTYTVYFSIVQ